MTLMEMLLWLLGAVGGVVLLCYGICWLEREFPGQEYDERQQVVRGKAYRAGFYVGAMWTMRCLLFLACGMDTDELIIALFFGFMLQDLTFHIYCLLNHANLRVDQKRTSAIISYGASALFWAVMVGQAMAVDARYPEKPQAFTWVQLGLVVYFATLCVLQLIQHLRDRKT